MKLDYKKTIFVGFAFFLICAFWQAYEAIVPLMLVNKFGMNQTFSGIIMAFDNILAVFMLPIFGSLSDKSKSKYGKRTPYIIIGTIVAIVAFIGLSFADNAQLAQINSQANPQEFQQILWDANTDITNAERTVSHDKNAPKQFSVKNYAATICFNKSFDNCSQTEKDVALNWFLQVKLDKTEDGKETFTKYYYNYDLKQYLTEEGYEALPQAQKDGYIAANAYNNLVTEAHANYAWEITKQNPVPLIFFIAILLVVLVAMATFRSPAVALMPDVTIKPLRSQGNAVINLMGTFGAMLVLLLGMIFGTGKISNQTSSFTWYIVAVCAIMALGLTLFIAFVREPEWVKQMQEQSAKLGIDTKSDEIEDYVDSDLTENSGAEEGGITELRKKDKKRFTSLLLILASVALWYTGYNAISSKYSLYATNILHKDYNMTLLIAQAAAILAYIPAGILAGKIGRKKSILGGVLLLAIAFLIVSFFTASTPAILINVFFALGGIGWATINVNSFPMVVELAKGGNVGKYTGYYYTASMAAQILTPIISGVVMDLFGSMRPLFIYGTIFVVLSFITMLFVKHGDNLVIRDLNKEGKTNNI